MAETAMVTISEEEYLELKDDSRFLECLFSAGVDNWLGYDYAQEIFNSENEQ